jgi:hypothetical protein
MESFIMHDPKDGPDPSPPWGDGEAEEEGDLFESPQEDLNAGMDEDEDKDEDDVRNERLYRLAMESGRALIEGLAHRSEQAAEQLIGTLYFMMTVADLYGGVFAVGDCPDGSVGEDGEPIKAIMLRDASTGDPIDSTVILDRVGAVVALVKQAHKAGQGDDLGDTDL